MPARNLVDRVSLNPLRGFGPITISRALERLGDPREIAHRLPVGALATLRRLRAETLARVAEARRTLRRRAESKLRRAERLGLRPLTAARSGARQRAGALWDRIS